MVGEVVLVVLLMGSRPGLPLDQLTDMQSLMDSREYSLAMLSTISLSQILVVIGSLVVIRLVVGKDWPRVLALRLPSLTHLVLALLGLAGLIVIVSGLDNLVKQVVPGLFDYEKMIRLFGDWPWPLGVLIIGLGPGIGEELWCRGFLGRGLVGRHGVLGGVLLTSLLFGLIHLEPRQAIGAMGIGLFLHFSYLASRSLLVPMLLHTANNSLSILALHIPALESLDKPAVHIPWYVYAAAVLLLAIVVWGFSQSWARLADRPGEGTIAWRPAYPGVEYPPPGTATRVVHPRLAWHAWIVVAASLVLFAGSIYLAR
jgi:membrane protease YdiL (CAAX protease family)